MAAWNWRIGVWAAAGGVFALPLLAMLATDAVAWHAADFALLGAMLAAAIGMFELVAASTRDVAYRAAAGLALATGFVLVWATLAVGFVGAEDDPANRLIAGVLAVAIVGTIVARGRPRGMALTLMATALAQAMVPAIAGAARIIMPTAAFVAMWLAAAWLFRRAALSRAAQ